MGKFTSTLTELSATKSDLSGSVKLIFSAPIFIPRRQVVLNSGLLISHSSAVAFLISEQIRGVNLLTLSTLGKIKRKAK